MSAPAFALPVELEAHEPPEARGLERDEVRLMVASRGAASLAHASFRELPELLDPGDLLVINNSATLPAAVPARRADGSELELRFAGPAQGMADGWWIAERRAADGGPAQDSHSPGEIVGLPGGATAALVAPYAGGHRLWLASVSAGEPLPEYLWRYGHPVQYSYVSAPWPLEAFQTAYALIPGSAEMPSAGRPFTPALITALVARGVLIAPLTLHTGLSSPERDEAPQAERFEVPATTADAVNAVHGWGGRVIAVRDDRRPSAGERRRAGRVRAGQRRMDQPRDHAGARIAGDRRSDQRLARARGLAPAPAGGGRRIRGAAGALLRGRARAGLSVARVRRQPPHRALI